MDKISKGNILLTFVMMMAFSMIVFAFITFIGFRIKESGNRVSEIESFYVAEAGLNKAIWYLGTSTGSGGKGLDWRTTGTYEAYGWGSFSLIVQTSTVTGEVLIVSTGEVTGIRKTVSQVVATGGYPSAFDYAVFNNGSLNLSGNAEINGDVFVNGNTVFSGSATVANGYAYHPAGDTVSGHGTYTDGGTPDPVPSFPSLDTSYYSGQITTAQDQSAGNQTYNNTTVNLGGGTVYVNGDINVSGTTTFNGPGVVVASGAINFSGNTYTSGGVRFISAGTLSISGNQYTQDSLYYSNTAIAASGNTRVNVGGFISGGTTSLNGNINVSGLIYSVGQISLVGNPAITGAMLSGSLAGVTGLSGSTLITYDDSVFLDQLPPGFTPSTLSRVKGTWKEM